MPRFLQLSLLFLFVAAAVTVSDSSANEAAISDDYLYDYDLYSYDDIIDALYSDEGEETTCITSIPPTVRQSSSLFPAEELLPSESRQRPQRRKKRPKGRKRQKQQEFAKANQEVKCQVLYI